MPDATYHRYRLASGGRLWHLVPDDAGYRAEAACGYQPAVRWHATRYDRRTLESPEYGYTDDLCRRCRALSTADTGEGR